MSKYKGKKVLIVGFGLSGVSVAKYMVEQGAKVMVTDLKQKPELLDSIKACQDLPIEYELGKHNPRQFQIAELIVVSPGVPLNMKLLDEAREKQIPIVSEVELASRTFQQPLIAITGTNGKTTTTTLIGEMFKADGKMAFVGGNIGLPLIEYARSKEPWEAIVAELSSFQLELVEKMVPAVALFTNIDQDHLDRYGTMDAYIAAKKKLLLACDKNSYVIFNHDDLYLVEMAKSCPGKVLWFLKRNPMELGGEFAENFRGAYFIPGEASITFKMSGKEEVYDTTKIRIFGDHNKENLMAAICAARSMGIRPKAIQQVIDTFPGVSHRLEFIRKKDGVFFFNDSKATNVMSVYRSLGAFKKSPIILIAGGKDKNMDFAPLADLVRSRCKIIVLLGEAKEKINRAIGDFAETYLVGTFEEAVLLAYQKSRNGDIILLSPGCASYDMFRNFEERGDYFKKLINQL